MPHEMFANNDDDDVLIIALLLALIMICPFIRYMHEAF